MGGAGGDLEAGDGVLPGLLERLVDPGHDGVVGHLLPVAQLLQDVEGVPEHVHETPSAPEGLLLIRILTSS